LVAVIFNISSNYAINQQVKHYFCMTDMTGKYFLEIFLSSKNNWTSSLKATSSWHHS